MAKLYFSGELEYDADLIHGEDEAAIDWFIIDILGETSELILHCNKMGDTIGTVRLTKITPSPPKGTGALVSFEVT